MRADGLCTVNANGNGCYTSVKTDPCNDNNLCTNEYCSSATQSCIRSDVSCPDKNCYTKSCSPSAGCVYSPICKFLNSGISLIVYLACDDGRPCTIDSCNAGTGRCENVMMNCDDYNACTIDSCDEPTGQCRHVQRTDCTDSLVCTRDSCDPNRGCVFDTIIEGLTCNTPGCLATPPGSPCNDNDACTNEYCDSNSRQCVRSAVQCPDKPCFNKRCDSASGCVYTPVGK